MIKKFIFPDDENGQVLRQMSQDGDDLSKPREVTFNVVFKDEISANKFSGDIHYRGCHIKITKSNVVPERPWDVAVIFNMIPSHSEISAIEKDLGSMASKYDGINDGWGCFSQSK